jgi:hypothetical protein
VETSRYLLRLLRDLEHVARSQGASWPDLLRPGLTEDEIDGLTQPLGLTLPVEARTLFAWHDGVESGANPADSLILPPARFVGLRELTALYGDWWWPAVEEIAASDNIEPSDFWPREYFPVLHGSYFPNGNPVMIRALTGWDSVIPDQHSPVARGELVPFQDADRLPSLIAFFEIWLGWIEAGGVHWREEGGGWLITPEFRHRSTWAAAFS